MSNRIEKPMLTLKQLVRKMRDDKGIAFKYVTEEKAEEYLTNVNNYMRTASYRQNYQKYLQGTNKGKYIELDFAYLQELSTIDMHFRFLVSRMCIDIEQALKVKLIREAVKEIPFITTSQRQKKLSCRPMLEFVTMVYLYNQVVTEKVKYHRIKELKRLFFVRMPEKKGFFEKNELIRSNCEFACKIIQGFC